MNKRRKIWTFLQILWPSHNILTLPTSWNVKKILWLLWSYTIKKWQMSKKGDDTKWDKKHLLPKELLWANNDGRRESPQLSEAKICLKLYVFLFIIFSASFWRSDKAVSRLSSRKFYKKTNKRICLFLLWRPKQQKNPQICLFVFLGESTRRQSDYGFIWPLDTAK